MRLVHILPLLSAGFAATYPLETDSTLVTRGSKVGKAADVIEAIMPGSKSCKDAQFPDECRTAQQAADFIIQSMANFTTGQIGAMLALIAVESGEMKFKHNVYPGRPGQGTSNMMMSEFVIEYATSIFGADKVEGKDPNDVLAMVTPDEYNFGSAPWFLRTKCSQDVQDKLRRGTDEGWAAYMGCIGVPPENEERQKYWTRAKDAFGL